MVKVLAAVLSLQGLFFFVAAPAKAAISSGMPAIDVVGQYDASVTDRLAPNFIHSGANGGTNRLGLSQSIVANVVRDPVHHRLFVIDVSNVRVLVYSLNTDNTLTNKTPTHVLGQTDFNSSGTNAQNAAVGCTTTPNACGFSGVRGGSYDAVNDRLFLSDSVNHRVMVFDLSGGITNGMAATWVLGQPNLQTTASGTSTAITMNAPRGQYFESSTSTRLFVSDQGNNRVLVYDVASIVNGEAAVGVLGQPDLTHGTANATNPGNGCTTAISACGMNAPNNPAYDSSTGFLYVSELNNNRVLVFDANVVTDGEAAVRVLGQADFTTSTANLAIPGNGCTTSINACGMNTPRGMDIDVSGRRMFVNDNSARVLIFDITAVSDGEAAVNVLGNSSLTTTPVAGTAAGQFSNPHALMYDSSTSRLYVHEFGNARVSIFDAAAVTNGEAAIDEIGQYDGNSADWLNTTTTFGKGGVNNSPNRWTFNPNGNIGMAIDAVHHRLFVPDSLNNRVLVYDLNADDTLTDMLADFVLGQADFNASLAATTQAGMNNPQAVAYDSVLDRLFVTESGGNRVTVFDVALITNGEAAANVLGQPNFTSTGVSLTATGLQQPRGIAYDSALKRLFVVDNAGNRVMVWDLNTIANGQAAANVLGQTLFTTATANLTQSGLNAPSGITFDAPGNRLFVADSASSRVMVFDVAVVTNGENAIYVLGKADFTSGAAELTQSGIRQPRGLSYDAVHKHLFVSEVFSHRTVVFDISATTTSGMNASWVIGQTDFTSSTAATTQTGSNSAFASVYDAVNDRLFLHDAGNSRIMVYDAASSTGTVTPTRNNAVTLSNAAASATATVTVSYQLMHNLSGTTTVTFPAGFTVTSAATAPASSPCFSGFGFTANTLTATKTNCAGPLTLGGATVTNPASGGSYTISWVNDDPGSANVTITSGGGGGGSTPPTVTVTQPNGGETLSGSSTYQVVWSSGGSGISSYKLSYSSDAGTSWTDIATGLTANFHDWIVPNISTNSAKMKVEAQNGGSTIATDESNSVFTINPTSAPPTTPPPSTPPPDSSTSTPPTTPPPTSPPPEPTPPPHDFVPTQEAAKAPSIDDEKELAPVANPACAPGSLIRGSRSTVYYCGKDGVRYPFPNAKTFFTWYPDFSQVQRVPDSVLSRTRVGAYVTYKPGVKMVKIQTNPKTYGVAEGGIIRHVPTETVARDLYGTDWNRKIDDIPLVFWGSYKLGPPIQ